MTITALYRKSSGEVIKISTKGQPFTDADPQFWGVLIDSTRPDGDDVVDESGDLRGPLRELGFAKIADVGSNTARNATQAEIDTFESAQEDDENIESASRATDLLENHPQFRRAFMALAAALEDALPPGQRRTKGQLIAAAKAHVSKDD